MNGGIVVSRYLSRAKDPWSSMTHLWGAVLSLVGTILLVGRGLQQGAGPDLISAAAVFGFSLMALYTASATYHYVRAAPNVNLILRKLDHSMIYVLIAGSYTPVLLGFYPAPERYRLTAAIWAIAFVGIAVKLLWFGAPRVLYTGFYVLMGWFALIDVTPLAAMPAGALALIFGGGIAYTVGGLIYAFKKPNLFPNFGHHELFHIFVLLGSLQHYLLVLLYIL